MSSSHTAPTVWPGLSRAFFHCVPPGDWNSSLSCVSLMPELTSARVKPVVASTAWSAEFFRVAVNSTGAAPAVKVPGRPLSVIDTGPFWVWAPRVPWVCRAIEGAASAAGAAATAVPETRVAVAARARRLRC